MTLPGMFSRRGALGLFKVATVGAAAVAVAVAAAGRLWSWYDPFDDAQFDSARWTAAGSRWDERTRASMARDLIRHHLPRGMTAEEVVTMLGPPDDTNTAGGGWVGRKGEGPAYYYFIGSWNFGGLDTAILCVHLDGNSRVVGAEIGGG